MLPPLNVLGLEGWIRRHSKTDGGSPYIFWPSLLDVLPQGVDLDDPRVQALLRKYRVALETRPEGLKKRATEPVDRRRVLCDPEPPPYYMTAPLTALEMEMLLAAEAGKLKRAGWKVAIDGRRASVVTLKRLQDRQLIKHIRLTEEGWEVLTFRRSLTAATMLAWRA